jgi:hypothetical protein
LSLAIMTVLSGEFLCDKLCDYLFNTQKIEVVTFRHISQIIIFKIPMILHKIMINVIIQPNKQHVHSAEMKCGVQYQMLEFNSI